jgi:quercetin dioxygenase-like cupin family protein
MPYVAPGEAHDVPFLDLDALAGEAGPPPWRICLVGTRSIRVLLLHWPAGFATVPHLHPAAEETFQVLRGRAIFNIGDEPACEAGPGQYLLALRGVRHSIRVAGDEPLTMIATVAPNQDLPNETIDLA